MNFARSLNFVRIIWLTLILGVPAVGFAQAPVVTLDVSDSQQALGLMSEGKYDEAIALYKGIPNKYPTSPMIPESYFRLGYLYFMKGNYDEAVVSLKKNLNSTKPVSPDIIELTYSFMPQVLAAKAYKLDEKDPKRNEAFAAALKEYDTFAEKYPQSDEIESVNYGKAQVYYSMKDYDKAATTLRASLTKYAKSPSAPDTQFMLALVIGTQANTKMLANPKDLAPLAMYDEATKLLADIITKGADLALANDAQFQLAEMLSARASFETKETKTETLTRALAAYGAVLPKEAVAKIMQDRMALVRNLMEKAKATDPALLKRLEHFLKQEMTKAAGIDQRPDQTLPAKFKAAQIYLNLEKFNEARVLLQYLEPKLETPEQKKQALYFVTVSYAAQNLTAKAVEGYNKWMAAYKTDPMGENLPLLIGLAYLSHQDSENAIKYFTEQQNLFPKSDFTADAVMRQALALIPLERYDEALAVLSKFVSGSPSVEQGAAAQLGIATIYQKTQKLDEALAAFAVVRDKYKSTAEAEQAAYWVAQITLTKGEPAKAASEIKKFINDYPTSEMIQAGYILLGQAQSAAGEKEAALKTFADIAEKFPKTDPGAISFFQRASIFQKDNQYAEVKDIMRKFLQEYPDHDRVFAAYDYIAQIQNIEKTPKEAIATYDEFVKKYPTSKEASKAMAKQCAIWLKYGESQGLYVSLNEEQRKEWSAGIDGGIEVAEKLLEKYPESPDVATALQALLNAQKLKVRFKLRTDKDVLDYFQKLADQYDAKPTTKSKIQFTLAGYLSEKNDNKAWSNRKVVELMDSAFNEKLVYSPVDLDIYGSALIEGKQFEKAQKIYEKIGNDYPVPANVPKEKIPRTIAEAQAMALFGSAKILQAQNKTKEASAIFTQLQASYPNSPKILEADYGIAQDEYSRKEYAPALERLGKVARASTVPASIRAKAMLLIGQIEEEQGNIDGAINNYIKLGTLFPAESETAPEGFWRGGQLIEKKLAK